MALCICAYTISGVVPYLLATLLTISPKIHGIRLFLKNLNLFFRTK